MVRFLLTLVVIIIGQFNSGAQKRNYFKPDPELLNIINASLSRSASQYKILIKTLPDSLFPRTFEKGTLMKSSSSAWISGFYPGTLLLLYEFNKNPEFKDAALKKFEILKKEQFNAGTHDLGFMMYCSFGTAKIILKTNEYDTVLLNSAASLSKRFHKPVGLIKSWDHKKEKWEYPVIIDNMMNLELLTWATRTSKDSSFYKIAVSHADKTLNNHFRNDYSSYHVVDYDPKSGKVLKRITEQGYSDESSWARGQAWGLYGYMMMYRETGDRKYLQQANHIADFILNHPHLPKDKIPYWDFDAAGIPNVPRDVSAAAVICSALIELSQYVDKRNSKIYLNAAAEMIRSMSSPDYFAEPGTNGGFVLKHSVGFMLAGTEVDVPLSYADYYYIEALLRYKNLNIQK